MVELTSALQMPYWKGLVKQFSNTYDIYLSILHGINMRVCTLLKQDTPDWRMLNVCSPCLYTLENEPHLKHTLLTTLDGNQSLKLVDSAFCAGTLLADSRCTRSDFWIPPDEVDYFKDEVGQAKARLPVSADGAWPGKITRKLLRHRTPRTCNNHLVGTRMSRE